MSNKPAPNDQELRELKKKIKIGKKLQPREKALAEAATLLTFKKIRLRGIGRATDT